MKKLMFLLVFCAVSISGTWAQKTFNGKVIGPDGLGLPGVNVVEKANPMNGAATDIDGNWTLTLPDANSILQFSAIGMKAVEIAAKDAGKVTMKADAQLIDEIVVLGYGSQNKSELTGSSVQIKSDQLADMPVASVDQSLQGKVAGLAISSSSGTPGSVQDIRIRGISSITAKNSPLYVIDGVPMNNTDIGDAQYTGGSSLSELSSLNSSDIKNITVLKDASATAAYGARGANGVIVITTKSGQEGKAKIEFKASYGFSNDAIDGPDVLTGAQREMLTYEAVKNRWGQATIEEAKDFYENALGRGDYKAWHEAGAKEGNWADVITNDNAPMQEYNLSASGGNENSNYYASIGYFDQEATVIGADFYRVTGKLNFQKNLRETIIFSSNNTGAYTEQDGILEGSAYYGSPRTAKFFISPLISPYNEDGSINLSTGTMFNPLFITKENIDKSKYTRIISNNSLTWDTPIENLSFTTRFNIDFNIYNYRSYRNPILGDGRSKNGSGEQSNRNRVTYSFQNSLNYLWEIDDNNKFDFTLLQEWQKYKGYYLQAAAEQFSDVNLYNLSSAGSPTSAYSSESDWVVGSYLAMIHYSAFQGRYVADLTYRREGNSRFSKDNRWGNFGAIGVAWNIHKESFMEDYDFISNLKFRASYGITGNANINTNQFQSLLYYSADYAGEGASYIGTFGNKNLTWEKSKTLDLGLDFGFLENRITGSFAYYKRKSTDLLLNVPLSFTTGVLDTSNDAYQTRNIGEMENSGIELSADFDIVRSEDFNLSIGGNLATAKNEVLKLAKDPNGKDITITTSTQRTAAGHPVRGWYMPTWAGVNPETGDEEFYINGVDGKKTTDFNEAEAVWQGGSALPKVTAGLNFHVDFKGVFLDASAYYAGGHKVYEEWHRYINYSHIYPLTVFNGLTTLLDRWQQPGDQARNGKMYYNAIPWERHSKYLYNGDFIRLKDVTLGYDFNEKILEKLKLSGIKVFVRGTNLLTWVKEDNLVYDPEIDATGFTGMRTPPVKSVIFGINVKF